MLGREIDALKVATRSEYLSGAHGPKRISEGSVPPITLGPSFWPLAARFASFWVVEGCVCSPKWFQSGSDINPDLGPLEAPKHVFLPRFEAYIEAVLTLHMPRKLL